MEAAPPAMPVTVPEPLIVAIPVLLLDHDPPPGEPDKLSVLPTQTLLSPVLELIVIVGDARTVTEMLLELAVQVPFDACRK